MFRSNGTFRVLTFPTKEEWAKNRVNGIGGSDAACILGQNPWKTNQQLWLEKVNREEVEIEDNKAMEFGRNAEPIIRQLFALNHPEYEMFYVNNVSLINKEYPFLMYSPDGLLIRIADNKKGVWECKTGEIKSQSDRDAWNGKLPMNYFIQCLQGLIVTGYDFVILTAYLKHTDREGNPYWLIKEYLIDREGYVADLELLKGKEIEFWDNVVNKVEPPLLLTL